MAASRSSPLPAKGDSEFAAGSRLLLPLTQRLNDPNSKSVTAAQPWPWSWILVLVLVLVFAHQDWAAGKATPLGWSLPGRSPLAQAGHPSSQATRKCGDQERHLRTPSAEELPLGD